MVLAHGTDQQTWQLDVPSVGEIGARLEFNPQEADLDLFLVAPDGRIAGQSAEDRMSGEYVQIQADVPGRYLLYVRINESRDRSVLQVPYEITAYPSPDMAQALSRGDEHGAEIVARQTRPVQAVALSPDNRSLAIGVQDQRAWLWRLSDGEPIRSFDDHRGWVTALAFAPDGSLLVSRADDGDARFWRPGDGSLVRFVRSPKQSPFPEQVAWSVIAVAVSPDGQMLATAGEEGPHLALVRA